MSLRHGLGYGPQFQIAHCPTGTPLAAEHWQPMLGCASVMLPSLRCEARRSCPNKAILPSEVTVLIHEVPMKESVKAVSMQKIDDLAHFGACIIPTIDGEPMELDYKLIDRQHCSMPEVPA
jgi:hypothetical protein